MDNLPKDPPSPQSPQIPQTPPIPPDNIVDPVQSWIAQHEQRDATGKFVKSSQTPPNPSSPSVALPKEGLPPIIEVNQNSEPTYKKDPPAFGFFITNPITYFKAFLNRLIKRQAITVKIPVLAIIVLMVGIGGFGVGFQSGINWALFKIFPNYSPILHRAVTKQGTIQKSSNPDKGYVLASNDKDKTIWILQSSSANVKLGDYVKQNVQVKGNLTSTPNLIDVSEIISFAESSPTPVPASPAPNINDNSTGGSNISNPADLPKLYSNLTWEVTQSKTLTFTSGKRRIEQEGVYLESSQVTDIPKDFMDYYTKELISLGFKQTLNSSEPNGTTITYSKNDLFLTFGVKNIYKGSGDSKKLIGYKAYLEHN